MLFIFGNSLVRPGKQTIQKTEIKGAMSHTAHVRDEALHLENVRQLFQVLRVIQYQEFIVIYRSHPLTVRIVKR